MTKRMFFGSIAFSSSEVIVDVGALKWETSPGFSVGVRLPMKNVS